MSRIDELQAIITEATRAGDRKQLEIDRARGRIAALEAAVSELRADYTISHAMHGEETIAAWLDRVLACVAPAPIVKHAEHDAATGITTVTPLGYLTDIGAVGVVGPSQRPTPDAIAPSLPGRVQGMTRPSEGEPTTITIRAEVPPEYPLPPDLTGKVAIRFEQARPGAPVLFTVDVSRDGDRWEVVDREGRSSSGPDLDEAMAGMGAILMAQAGK